MSLNVKGFLKQLFSASESDKDGMVAEFQADVDQARAQLQSAEGALVMVRGMLGRAVEPPRTIGAKFNGPATGPLKHRNGSASITDQDMATVFDLVQGGRGKIGDLVEKTGQDRSHLKKVLGAMLDGGTLEMHGVKGGARYVIAPGASRPMVASVSSAPVEESNPGGASPPLASEAPPVPAPSAAPEETPAPEPASAAPEPAPTPDAPAGSSAIATDGGASEPTPAGPEPRARAARRTQSQNARP